MQTIFSIVYYDLALMSVNLGAFGVGFLVLGLMRGLLPMEEGATIDNKLQHSAAEQFDAKWASMDNEDSR